MTAQCPETLLLRGEKLKLCTEPLGQYLKTMDNPIRFHATTTVLWRGYIGTWAIEQGRLYLKELWGNQGDEDGYSEVGMEALFPNYPDGVFAHWFTGELRCPQGELIEYTYGGYASMYEMDLFLAIQQGQLTSERLAVNGPPRPPYDPKNFENYEIPDFLKAKK